MLINAVETKVVGATNNGFGGQELTTNMAGAVKLFSSNNAFADVDNNNMAKAMNSLMPSAHSATVSADESISRPMTPGIGLSDHDKGR